MNKPDLQRHAAAMRSAIGETLNALRVDGICRLCNARAGEQHHGDCPSWPIIRARSAYAMAADASAISMGTAEP